MDSHNFIFAYKYDVDYLIRYFIHCNGNLEIESEIESGDRVFYQI